MKNAIENIKSGEFYKRDEIADLQVYQFSIIFFKYII